MMRKYLVRFLEGRGAAMRSAYSAFRTHTASEEIRGHLQAIKVFGTR